MRSVQKFVAVAVVAGVLGTGASVWAQGEWKAPASEAAKKNPEKGVSDKTKKDVQAQCTPCHGSGKGDGPAAAALNPKPADWTSARVQKESDGELFWKISTGRGPMPPWKDSIPEKERWEIVNYLRTFKKK